MPATNVSKVLDQSHESGVFDLAEMPLRELNQALHNLTPGSNETAWEVLNPKGSHS
ncbi:MAG: protein GlxC, partial [Mesorhizobium sp.]